MGRKKAEKSLKETVEEGIMTVLNASDEPSDGRIKALALGIKMCALNAKLEEADYGEFFTQPGPSAGDAKGKKPSGGRRANGADDTIDAIIEG